MASTMYHAVSPTLNMRPFEHLRQCAGAYYLSACLHVVAEAGVPDALGDQAATAPELAAATGVDARALARVLSLLAVHGIFERRDLKFAHTAASRLLRADEPGSMRSGMRLFGLPMMWTAVQDLGRVVKTGRANPAEFWSQLDQDPVAAEVFNEAMTEHSRLQAPAVTASYDFSQFASIADIGGGRGHLIEAILAATPSLKGTLFDLPRVIEQIAHKSSDRLVLLGGNFFEDEFPRCDAYILMGVIHDWPDEEARAILGAVRKAAPADARLLLVEALMPSESVPSWTMTLDIAMLNLFGEARQRTEDEFRSLVEDAGFRLQRIIDLGTGHTILEALAA